MNIQIFGNSKCFDTKKAERYFKERRIPFQRIDLRDKGISRGELQSVLAAVGGVEKVLDTTLPDAALVQYLAFPEAKVDKLMECPDLLRTPIVRCGKKATVGYCPEIWKDW